MKKYYLKNSKREITQRELQIGYITLFTLSQRVGKMILCNEMSQRYNDTMHLINGTNYNEEAEDSSDIFQWYIITEEGAAYLTHHTDELVFYDNELNLYVWGITHYGTSWKYVYTNIEVTDNADEAT